LSDAVHNAYLFEPLEEQSILPRISLSVHHIQLKTIEILHKQILCLERYLSLKNESQLPLLSKPTQLPKSRKSMHFLSNNIGVHNPTKLFLNFAKKKEIRHKES
jgi:hypothetical protein